MSIWAGADICGAAKANGEPCQQRAGHGTSHMGTGRCRTHGGKTPTQVLASAHAALSASPAVRAASPYPTPLNVVDVLDVLTEQVAIAAGNVHWLRQQIELDEPGAIFTVAVEKDGAVSQVDGVSAKWKIYLAERQHVLKAATALAAHRASMSTAQRVGSIAGQLVTAAVDTLDPSEEQRAAAMQAALDLYAKIGASVGAE
jgi:hypothetical protein